MLSVFAAAAANGSATVAGPSVAAELTAVESVRPRWEVADVVRVFGAGFLQRQGATLSWAQRRVLRDIANCRTAKLGGHVERCDHCAYERISYNSCRNRHCPKCQGAQTAAWVEREGQSLLPVPYYHVVFTLPEPLRPVALQNPRVVYDLLFQAASETLREVAVNPRHLGARLGVVMTLHTWGQQLEIHPHVHCVVTGGGLACDAKGRLTEPPCWRSFRPGFFLPYGVLKALFRGKMLAYLKEAHSNGELHWHGRLAELADPQRFNTWLTPLYQTDWCFYAKAPFGGPEQVLKYLARYTHRVAISNSRLLDISADGAVTLRWKDYRHHNEQRTLRLAADEFLRRFLLHVLPKRFVKIRHYGLVANRGRDEHLECCRRLLFLVNAAAQLAALVTIAPLEEAHRCPVCGVGHLVLVAELPPQQHGKVSTTRLVDSS